jgi:hypothetical protein
MNNEPKQLPSHDVFVVTGDESARWLRIGAAFPNKDGKGFNLSLDALPAKDGRMVMREFQAKSASQDEPTAQRDERGDRRERNEPDGRRDRQDRGQRREPSF